MTFEREIELLESEWSADDGFFWRIRQGRFEPAEFRRALQKLASLSIAAEAQLPRRVVSLLWYIPPFMQWQAERVRQNRGDTAAYAKAITAMTNEIERLLGVP
ncbi:MAG TPA: hypothetical protein VLS93_17970 [Anaeromyxobacteraceae bacterium]|nr:hypothetical protein [Anaeromyxobacteraceae bacterium]